MARKPLSESLLDKGWKKEEVEEAMSTLYSKEPQKEITHKSMSRILYWSTLIVAIIGNFIVSLVLVPFLLVLSSLTLYFIIFVIGVSFGSLFNLLIRDIEYIDPSHHVIAGVFLPAIAIVTIIAVVNFANQFNVVLHVSPFHQNPIIVSTTYVIAFLLPYVIDQGFLKIRKK
ncbi:hypothetical protein KY311_00265 [Candidatus Woesearchaeota archaeon]|nr:hypothetical protein [Candidatus Woesearchaeota archaeon]